MPESPCLCARKTCQEEERGVCFWAAQPLKNTPHLIPFDKILVHTLALLPF
jgi:hypothetical protein